MRYSSKKINAVVVLVGILMLGGCQKEDPCNCEVPRACCRGLVPECAACEEGLTVEDWLKKTCPNGENDAYYGGWDEANQKSIWVCESVERQKVQITE